MKEQEEKRMRREQMEEKEEGGQKKTGREQLIHELSFNPFSFNHEKGNLKPYCLSSQYDVLLIIETWFRSLCCSWLNA